MKELINHDTERPYIGFRTVMVMNEPLGGHVKRRTDAEIFKRQAE